MAATIDRFIEQQLVDRRHKLKHAVQHSNSSGKLQLLLEEVDSALARIEVGTYGICETCHDPIECDRLIADPLVRFCLDHLTRQEKNALEQDLQLAAQVQRGLLPNQDLNPNGWSVCYHYQPAGPVSGDYCDVIDAGDAGLYFMVGDVSGKGVAASILMAHLHAMFRTLISVGMSLKCMLEHASSVFSKSTLPNQYATLVCGRALSTGRVEIANAGHPPPLVVRGRDVTLLETTDLPVGLFGSEEFSITELDFGSGQGLVIYSDGVSELTDISGAEYGVDGLRKLLARDSILSPSALVEACRNDLISFRSNARQMDDLTLFVLGRL